MKAKIRYVFGLLVLFLSSCSSIPSDIQELEKLTIFKVSQDQKAIVLDGVINSSAYTAFKKILKEHPNINRLEIVICDGSINDKVNLKLAKFIHKNSFTIHLRNNGLVASGGTDLFLAGTQKTLGKNTKIGVHSWAADDDQVATDFPKGHKYHIPYIDYYKSVGFSQQQAEDFYYFTINAAPASDVHWMTQEEIERFNLLK